MGEVILCLLVTRHVPALIQLTVCITYSYAQLVKYGKHSHHAISGPSSCTVHVHLLR
jgi:hypothetical protein